VDAVPVARMRDFERDFREALRLKHADVMAGMRASGAMSDEAAAAIAQEARDVAATYTG